MTTTTQASTAPALVALRDIVWMARRWVSNFTDDPAQQETNAAIKLLEEMLTAAGMHGTKLDPTANRRYDEDTERIVEEPSIWVDFLGPHTPDADQKTSWTAMGETEKVQWISDRLHTHALAYADGRSTYAPGMFNDATVALIRNNVNLDLTNQNHGRLWAGDGMGPGYDHRDRVLAATQPRSNPTF